MPGVLKILNVSKRFGTALALDRVELNLAMNQTHILLGSSGSGKSTLLRAMLGLIHPDVGHIELQNEPVASLAPQRRAALMGYVPQDGGLFPHLTARDNAVLVARAQGWTRDRIQQRLEALTQMVSLEPGLLDRFPNQLSGGQKQRVALLRAAFLDPQLLMLDEPLGALDPLVRADLQTELKDVFSRLKKTVVFVTHDIGEAAFLGDQIILMHEGRVIQTGRLTDLRDRPATAFVTRFLNAQRVYDGGAN